jgi:hypothetical protein
MKPRESQIRMAERAFAVLKANALVYLAAEERTGKTLASILVAEKCTTVNRVLVVTKKKALDGWRDTLKKFKHTKQYTVTNYHQAKKVNGKDLDLVILDEAHNYIASSPKPSGLWKTIKPLTKNLPLIYISATPHAQGYQQLFHQLALSSWSPWVDYINFYKWFKDYGVPNKIWIQGQMKETYTKTKEELIRQETNHLFITATRRELGFEHEPEDKLHYITLKKATKQLYNDLMKKRLAEMEGEMLVCDTPMKLRVSLHMLEGGVAKIEDKYIVLDNTEKIDYIIREWGDTNDMVIFYHYIAEGEKLRKIFANAEILQGTSYAEGVDLSKYKHLIVYSQDFSTAKHTQRRARQANFKRKEAITVHYLVVEKAISEQAYHTVSVNKTNFVDSVFERIEL